MTIVFRGEVCYTYRRVKNMLLTGRKCQEMEETMKSRELFLCSWDLSLLNSIKEAN